MTGHANGRLIPLFVAIVAASACNHDDDSEYSVRLETDTMSGGGVARVVLWGTNAYVADNAATQLHVDLVPVDAFPIDFKATWPNDAHDLIQSPPVANQSDARYFLSFAVDVDDDGLICQGDLIQDFEATPFFSLTSIPGATLIVVMKGKESDHCEILSADRPVSL